MTEQTTTGLLDRQVAFVAALRDAGLPVSVAEGLDAVAVLTGMNLDDRERLRAGLAAALVKRQLHRPAFDTVFDVFYPSAIGRSVRASAPLPDGPPPPMADRAALDADTRESIRERLAEFLEAGDVRALDQTVSDAVDAFGAVPGRVPGRPTWSRMATLTRVSPETLTARLLDAVLGAGVRGGLAEKQARNTIGARITEFERRVDVEVRRRLAADADPMEAAKRSVRPTIDRISFLGATRADTIALRREIAPLARRLASRLALDRRRASRGQLDFRRTIRESLSSGGVPLTTYHRPRRPLKTDLVVLCDVSDSVSAFARFTLLLTYALREQFTKVRAFAFVDEIDEITRFFTPGGDPLDAVARLAAEADVSGLFGRTDYGRAITLFDERFGDAVGPRTSLLILGDARSNYGELALPVLSKLVGRAKHAYWLNPERAGVWDTGDSAASEYGEVLSMVECRNLAQLAEFVRELAS